MGFYVVQKLQLKTIPKGNQTGTLRYRLKSLPDVPENYVLKSANIVIQPDGSIAAITIDGLIDGEAYTLWATNNCGGSGVKKDIIASSATTQPVPPTTTVAPVTTLPPATTTLPVTTAPPATTVPPGTTVPPATTVPPVTTVPPATTTVPSTTTAAGTTTSSNNHLNPDFYSFSEGAIEGFCSLPFSQAYRSAGAPEDSLAANQRVQVMYRISADNGGSVDAPVIFEPGDTIVDVGATVPGSACTAITWEIIALNVIP